MILSLRSTVEKYDLEEENRRLLRTVKRQSHELKMLEDRFPGISAMNRDESGRFILPKISDEEVEKIIAAYCKES